MREVIAGVAVTYLMRDRGLIENVLGALVIYWVLGFVF